MSAFERASPYEVVAVRYGTRRLRKSECYLDYDVYGEPDAEIDMAYYFWIVRSHERTIVVDTGFDPAVGARRGRSCLCEPVEAFSRVRVAPESVSHLVLTHLHYDHAGNAAHFPNAEIIVQRRELDFWAGPGGRRPLFALHVEQQEIAHVVQRRREGGVRALEGNATIFPGVTAVCLGGHTPGQQVLVVRSARGPVVLASDAMHYYEELLLDRPFAIVADLEEMYQAYGTLRELSSEAPDLLVPGHDPQVMERYPAFDGAAGIAVRVA